MDISKIPNEGLDVKNADVKQAFENGELKLSDSISPWLHAATEVVNGQYIARYNAIGGRIMKRSDGKGVWMEVSLEAQDGTRANVLGTNKILDELTKGNTPEVVVRIQTYQEWQAGIDRAKDTIKELSAKDNLSDTEEERLRKANAATKSTYRPDFGLGVVDKVIGADGDEVPTNQAATATEE